MRLFRRQKNGGPEPSETTASRPQNMKILVLVVLAAAIVALSVVSLSDNQTSTSTSQTPHKQTTQTTKPQPSNKPSSSSPVQSGNTSSNLVDTGPGDMIALFVGASAVASGLYYRKVLKNLNAS